MPDNIDVSEPTKNFGRVKNEFSTDQDKIIESGSKKEYLLLLSRLWDILEDFYVEPERYSIDYEIMQGRALNALNWAFSGYGMTLEDAVERIKTQSTGVLTVDEIYERKMFLEVIENIVDFSVAEEYQMLQEITTAREYGTSFDDFSEDAEGIFEKYNKQYSTIENQDIWFSMSMALAWKGFSDSSTLTYYTQGDERVRDSHRALEGVSYLKSEFPKELIPPIDWACRCYIMESSDRQLAFNNPIDVEERVNAAVNPVFRVSPVHDGKVFGQDHPYFQVLLKDFNNLSEVSKKIKKFIGVL